MRYRGKIKGLIHKFAGPSVVKLMVFFSSDSQCWYFSHEPSSLFHHSVFVDLNGSVMKH